MIPEKYVHEESGEVYKIQKIDQQELKDHLKNAWVLSNDDSDRNLLVFTDENFALTLIYAVSHNGNFIGYCVVPVYSPKILMRIYITDDYRSKGIGSFLINSLKIDRLSCLPNNDDAIRLYENLGFNVIGDNGWALDYYRKPL